MHWSTPYLSGFRNRGRRRPSADLDHDDDEVGLLDGGGTIVVAQHLREGVVFNHAIDESVHAVEFGFSRRHEGELAVLQRRRGEDVEMSVLQNTTEPAPIMAIFGGVFLRATLSAIVCSSFDQNAIYLH